MYPHGRLLLASGVFSASLGLLIAMSAFIAGLVEASRDRSAFTEDSALHAVSLLIFFVSPAVAILSLLISVPASYIQWRRKHLGTSAIAISSVVLAYALIVPLLLPGSAPVSILIVGGILAISLVASSLLWRAAMPRREDS
jgi:hypothetical protein